MTYLWIRMKSCQPAFTLCWRREGFVNLLDVRMCLSLLHPLTQLHLYVKKRQRNTLKPLAASVLSLFLVSWSIPTFFPSLLSAINASPPGILVFDPFLSFFHHSLFSLPHLRSSHPHLYLFFHESDTPLLYLPFSLQLLLIIPIVFPF